MAASISTATRQRKAGPRKNGLRLGQTIGLFALVFCALSLQSAAQQPFQKFVVTVPTKTSVTTPPEAQIIHDLSDTKQAFAAQIWSLSSNSPMGMVVDFSIEHPFIHDQDPSAKSDAELSIQVGQSQGPANWVASQPVDSTAHAASDNDAVVQVASNAIGSAEVALQVSFLNRETDLQTGNYSTTVYCTIAMP